MTDILHRLAAGASGAEIFMSAPPHILAELIDDGLAVVDMSRGRPAMKITEKGREWHATEAMQQRYTHLDADVAGDAADAIGKFW